MTRQDRSLRDRRSFRWVGSLSTRTVVCLAIGILAATAFVELTDEVLNGDAEVVDRAITAWVQQFDAPPLRGFLQVVTHLGSFWVLAGVVLGVTLWALRRGYRGLVQVYVLAAIAGGVLNQLLKFSFQRPRPDLVAILTPASGYSFPSGHAMGSTIVLGMTAFVVARMAPRLRWYPYAIASLLVLVIGFSRVYLGVHWTTDVLAGFAAGAILLASVALATRPWRRKR